MVLLGGMNNFDRYMTMIYRLELFIHLVTPC